MSWTTPAELKRQVQKLWDRGMLLATFCNGKALFPRRLMLKAPDARQLSTSFPEVREWIAQLSNAAKHYRIVWRTINHRILGANELPAEIWIDSLDNALLLIGKQREAQQFAAMVTLTRTMQPALLPWLEKRPLRALELAPEWHRLLSIVAWRITHPKPAIYLRQIDLPGIHSKFIEQHRGVLGELFDLVLPPEEIDTTAIGVGGFCRRYGFQDKPLRVRFRILDPALALLPTVSDHDITVTQATFACLEIAVTKVFITENEINFLAFPNVPQAMVIFGAGYGFENLASVKWLHDCAIHYWGDLDTHGFAILNQLRRFFPHATSFLMDSKTLMEHQALWGIEPSPETGELTRLTAEESALYDQLRQNELGHHIRLEQERIGFEWLVGALGRGTEKAAV
uniref:Wadjet protein JetD C-terminal domain-containing protein n=1 Tax=Chlorobium chlorochromatii (strain CaD3) TaxID=340177 RepID=Q3ASB6_CHLCH